MAEQPFPAGSSGRPQLPVDTPERWSVRFFAMKARVWPETSATELD